MTPFRKRRVESPERCVKTRGLAAAMQALCELGPRASLDRVAEIAGCPKASLARVFSSKEELLREALSETGRLAVESLRDAARGAGGGRAGALAAAFEAARMARDPSYRGCPLTAIGAMGGLPWAEPILRIHKERVVGLYVEILAPELGERASLRARAIALVTDGIHAHAAAGMGQSCPEAALLALRLLIESP